MTANRTCSLALASAALLLVMTATVGAQKTDHALSLKTSRVTLNGTSNIHEWTAASTAAKLTRLALSSEEGKAALDAALEPGALTEFEVVIPVVSLSSPKDGIDKNMHKALKAQAHPEIVFRLTRLDAAAAGTFTAVGTMRIAAVEKEVSLPVTTERTANTLTVRGEILLVMTEFGIAPPKAMLGMLRTDPKVKVSFEVVLF